MIGLRGMTLLQEKEKSMKLIKKILITITPLGGWIFLAGCTDAPSFLQGDSGKLTNKTPFAEIAATSSSTEQNSSFNTVDPGSLALGLESDLKLTLGESGLDATTVELVVSSAKKELTARAGTLAVEATFRLAGQEDIYKALFGAMLKGAIASLKDPSLSGVESSVKRLISKSVITSSYKSASTRADGISLDSSKNLSNEIVAVAVESIMDAAGEDTELLSGQISDMAAESVKGSQSMTAAKENPLDLGKITTKALVASLAKVAKNDASKTDLSLSLIEAGIQSAVSSIKDTNLSATDAAGDFAGAAIEGLADLGDDAADLQSAVSKKAVKATMSALTDAGVSTTEISAAAKGITSKSLTALSIATTTGSTKTSASSGILEEVVKGFSDKYSDINDLQSSISEVLGAGIEAIDSMGSAEESDSLSIMEALVEGAMTGTKGNKTMENAGSSGKKSIMSSVVSTAIKSAKKTSLGNSSASMASAVKSTSKSATKGLSNASSSEAEFKELNTAISEDMVTAINEVIDATDTALIQEATANIVSGSISGLSDLSTAGTIDNSFLSEASTAITESTINSANSFLSDEALADLAIATTTAINNQLSADGLDSSVIDSLNSDLQNTVSSTTTSGFDDASYSDTFNADFQSTVANLPEPTANSTLGFEFTNKDGEKFNEAERFEIPFTFNPSAFVDNSDSSQPQTQTQGSTTTSTSGDHKDQGPVTFTYYDTATSTTESSKDTFYCYEVDEPKEISATEYALQVECYGTGFFKANIEPGKLTYIDGSSFPGTTSKIMEVVPGPLRVLYITSDKANTTLNEGDYLNIDITFSKIIDVHNATMPSLNLNSGGSANYISHFDDTLRYSYVVGANDALGAQYLDISDKNLPTSDSGYILVDGIKVTDSVTLDSLDHSIKLTANQISIGGSQTMTANLSTPTVNSLQSEPMSPESFDISWASVPDADSYSVKACTDSGCNDACYGETSVSSSELLASLKGLLPDTAYFACVKAESSGGDFSEYGVSQNSTFTNNFGKMSFGDGVSTTAVAMMDSNDDGLNDVFLASYDPNLTSNKTKIEIYIANSSIFDHNHTTFELAEELPVLEMIVYKETDTDQYPDLILGLQNGKVIQLENTSGAGFTRIDLYDFGYPITDLTVGHYNTDNLLDFAAGSNFIATGGTSLFKIFRRNGSAFATSTVSGTENYLTLNNIKLKGTHLDSLMVTESSGVGRILHNTESATAPTFDGNYQSDGFTAQTSYSLGGSNYSKVIITRLNNDEYPDAVVLDSTMSKVVTLLGGPEGATMFHSEGSVHSADLYAVDFDVKDMDKDGLVDIVVTGTTTPEPTTAWFKNLSAPDGSGGNLGFQQMDTFTVDDPQGVGIRDYDNDGFPDIVDLQSVTEQGVTFGRIMLYSNLLPAEANLVFPLQIINETVYSSVSSVTFDFLPPYFTKDIQSISYYRVDGVTPIACDQVTTELEPYPSSTGPFAGNLGFIDTTALTSGNTYSYTVCIEGNNGYFTDFTFSETIPF